MINFILGYLTGLLLSVFILLVLTYFRSSVEKRVTVIERKVQAAGPKPQGFIIEQEAEADVVRREIIEKNKAQGKSTNISELV